MVQLSGTGPIWIEVLSRHRDAVAERHRFTGEAVTIGRGYDNDVVVDDPYVAPRHVRISRDPSGALVAEDLGSAGGLFADGATKAETRIVLDGDRPIRIGRSYVRVRDSAYVVAPERHSAPNGRVWIAIVALTAVILGIELIALWLGQTGEPRPALYAQVLLGLSLGVGIWAVVWAVLCRVFAGAARFERHLLIALGGVLAVSLYNEFAEFVAFSLSWRWPGRYTYVSMWLLLALVCFLHLRAIAPVRLPLKATTVGLLCFLAVAAQTWSRHDTSAPFAPQAFAVRLKPPLLRLSPLQTPDAFLTAADRLKGDLDRMRTDATILGDN